MLTPSQFREWLETARPGAYIIYYRGNLGLDRQPVGSPRKAELNDLANEVGRAEMAGKVLLVQKLRGRRRIDPEGKGKSYRLGDFDYMAIRR